MEGVWNAYGMHMAVLPLRPGSRLDPGRAGWQASGMGDDAAIRVVPANEAGWDDLAGGLRGARAGGGLLVPALQAGAGGGVPGLAGGGAGGAAAAPGRVRRAGADERAGGVPQGEPVGWCAVEPRTAYPGLLRVYRVPWAGRAEDKADAGVWAVTCFFVRAGFRRQGVSAALARAAVGFARARGARALEGYPMLTAPGQEIAWGELSVGARSIFEAAGFREVSHPSPRRVVMRVEFGNC